MAFLFLLILSRLFYIQVIWGNVLQEKAIDQWTREIPIIANRGKIVDTNGVVLANNQDTYTVFVRKKAVSNVSELSKDLSEILEIDYDYVYNRLTKTSSSEVIIKSHVEKARIDKLAQKNYKGVYYSRDNSREYVYGDFLSQVLGFTSIDNSGQSGIERRYDKYLSGIDGEILYETDIVGVEIENSSPTYVPATNGLNVKLTIDYEIQELTEKAMEEAYEVHQAKSASCIVMNPQNGEILALAIKPSYNLNEIPREDISLLNKLSRNGIVSDSYEPGSTFKIITSAINVEENLNGNKNAFNLSHIYNSSRYRYIDGQKVKCWSDHKNGKHQNLDLGQALNNSCNPIFVDIAMSLGVETIYEYLNKFGFGQTTGIDFIGEASGMLLPKHAVMNVDLARIGFGQTVANITFHILLKRYTKTTVL